MLVHFVKREQTRKNCLLEVGDDGADTYIRPLQVDTCCLISKPKGYLCSCEIGVCVLSDNIILKVLFTLTRVIA